MSIFEKTKHWLRRLNPWWALTVTLSMLSASLVIMLAKAAISQMLQ